MSRLLSVATAVPAHRLEAGEALERLRPFWPQLGRLPGAEAAVGTRYLCEPVAALLRGRGLREVQAAYLDHSRELALAAAERALCGAQLSGRDIDLVISVSCTGYVVPSLDVHLAPELGLRPDVLRLPITELGCSGGAAGIAFAHRHLTAPTPSRSSRRFTDRPLPRPRRPSARRHGGNSGSQRQHLSDLIAMPASPTQGEQSAHQAG